MEVKWLAEEEIFFKKKEESLFKTNQVRFLSGFWAYILSNIYMSNSHY